MLDLRVMSNFASSKASSQPLTLQIIHLLHPVGPDVFWKLEHTLFAGATSLFLPNMRSKLLPWLVVFGRVYGSRKAVCEIGEERH